MVRKQQQNKAVGKVFMKYVSLNVLGMIGLSCYILADTFFVAKALGSNGLTALNLAIPVYSMIHGTGLMIGMGAATRYSIAGGKGRRDEQNHIFSQAAQMTAAAAVVFVLIGLTLSAPLSILLGADETVLAATSIYIKVILLFSPMFLFNNLLLCFVRNDGNPNLSMTAMLTGSFSNIILDYVFMFPLKMGMFGAVFATGLAPVISICVLSAHFFKKRNGFRLIAVRPEWKYMKDYCILGVSSLITEVSSGIVIILFNILILSMEGNTGVAAYGVIANLALVVIAVFTGIAQGIQPVISQAYGKGEQDTVHKVKNMAVVTAVLTALLIYVGSVLYADGIIGVFNSEKDIVLAAIAKEGLFIYFTGFFCAGINIVTAIYFSSVRRSGWSFLISSARGFLVIIPAAYLLSAAFDMTGVWLAFPAAEAITTAMVICFLVKEGKKRLTAG